MKFRWHDPKELEDFKLQHESILDFPKANPWKEASWKQTVTYQSLQPVRSSLANPVHWKQRTLLKLPVAQQLQSLRFLWGTTVWLFLISPWMLRAFLVTQTVKNLPTMWETRVRALGGEDPLEKRMSTHSSILAWRIPWTEKPGRLQFMGSQELDTTERLTHMHTLECEGSGWEI